jgi:hypothetical protein
MTRTLCLALALAALPLAGCGGSNDPGTPSSSERESGYDQMLKYSQCMRSHGLPNFPDPVQESGGGVSLSLKKGSGLDPGSQRFKAAESACRKLSPKHGNDKPIPAAEQQKFLRYSQCMRTHGVPQYPDPKFSGGGVELRMPPGLGPDSPSVQAAQQACKSMSPGAMFGKGGSTSARKG